jgi:hypothetical protein
VFQFSLKVYEKDGLVMSVSECITGRSMSWSGSVWVLAGFMATSNPVLEAHSPSQEALGLVNIM